MTGEDCSQPAGGRGADHVAPAVDDVDVDGVGADDAEAGHGRLAGAWGAGEHRGAQVGVVVHLGGVAGDGAGAEVQGGLRADQGAAGGVVVVGQEGAEGDFGEVGVAVVGLAVGVGELGGFDDGVDEVGA